MATKPRRDWSTESQAMEASGGEERAAGAAGNSALDEEIRRRAYQLYVERGEEHGRDRDDWAVEQSRFTSASRLAGKQAARFRTHSTRRKSSFVSKFRIPHFTPCFVSIRANRPWERLIFV
jgi:hypothetical protein